MKIREFMILIIVCVLAHPCNAPGEVITVGQDGGTSFSMIQDALDAASAGDEIIVAPGTYFENVFFNGKNVVLRSTDPMDWYIVETTIIDANASGDTVTFSGNEGTTCVLSGFTIRRARETPTLLGIGIRGNDTLASIVNNIIENNTRGIFGVNGLIQFNKIQFNRGTGFSGCNGMIQNNFIYINGIGSAALLLCSGTIQNNLIVGNAGFSGGGLAECNDATILNNLIVFNYAFSSSSSGGISDTQNAVIRNCIIRDNFTFYNGMFFPLDVDGATLSSSPPNYCNIAGSFVPGIGNITSEPLFLDSANLDFRLRPDSPCIDAGGMVTLTLDYEGNPRPFDGDGLGAGSTGDGSDYDIGPYEFGCNAFNLHSHLLGVFSLTSQQQLLFDKNADGLLDVADIVTQTP